MVRSTVHRWIHCIYITIIFGSSGMMALEARSAPMQPNHLSGKPPTLVLSARSYPKDWCLVTEGVSTVMPDQGCGGTPLSQFELPPKDEIQSFFPPRQPATPEPFHALARCSSLQKTVFRADVDLPFPIEPLRSSVKPLCLDLP